MSKPHSLVAASLMASLVTSCASHSLGKQEECRPGTHCTVSGTITIESRWQASLDAGNSCIALALPDAFFDKSNDFNSKHAFVTGDTFSQPIDAPRTASYHYEVDGMRVNANLCRMAMTVHEIRARDGTIWTK